VSRSPRESPRWLTLGVGSIGLTSFFSDSGHEIATALLPGFLTGMLHGSAATLGVIEGVSDAFMGVAKLAGGAFADDPRTRGRLAVGGYTATAVATGAIGLTTTVWQVGVLRGVAWAARGLRSPARDSLLASLTPAHAYGKAFGLERAGDNLGAVAGPLLAALLVSLVGIRPAIWFAVVPGLLAAVAITIATRQAARSTGKPGHGVRVRMLARYRRLHGTGLLRVMVPVALFEAGNLATTLVILRSSQLLETAGSSAVAAVALAVLGYAAHNAAAAVMAFLGGTAIDRLGARVVFAAGAGLYVLAYLGFALGPASWWLLLILFVVAGCGIGFVETAESALIARALPEGLRGTGFGLLGIVQAGGDLVATLVAGVLYTTLGPAAGFGYAAGWMLLAAVAAAAGGRRSRL
jgi:MFS family permease